MIRTYTDLCLTCYAAITQLTRRFNEFDDDFARRHYKIKILVDSVCLVFAIICLVASIAMVYHCFFGPSMQFGNGLAAINCTVLSVLQIVFVQSDSRKIGYVVIAGILKLARMWLSKLF